MIERYCSIYNGLSEDLGLELILANLESRGFRLCHPADKTFYELTPEGDRFESSLDKIKAKVEDCHSVNFLMWAEATRQLYVQVTFPQDNVQRQDYEFSALRTSPYLVTFLKAAFQIFGHAVELDKAIAMIVDSHGHTEDVDWDEFLFANAVPHELPDYLALLPSKGRLLTSKFTGFTEADNGFLVYQRDDMWNVPG